MFIIYPFEISDLQNWFADILIWLVTVYWIFLLIKNIGKLVTGKYIPSKEKYVDPHRIRFGD